MTTANINVASGSNSDTILNTILTVDQGRNILIYNAIFTNTTGNIITVSIYLSDGVDRVLEIVKIPAGLGKALDIKKLRGTTLEGNQSIKIQASSSDTFNYKLNGSQRT